MVQRPDRNIGERSELLDAEHDDFPLLQEVCGLT
jgi:hypothetical protein